MSVFQVWLTKSTPDNKRGMLFGWATSGKSCGWFLSSLAGGVVAMNLGVRWVYFGAAAVFILLVPVPRTIGRGPLRCAGADRASALPGE